MNIPENMKPNRTQAIGLIFLVISVFSYLGGFAWFSAYWDTEYRETYRDFEIYYFSNINVYGIKTEGDPSDWVHTTALSACRNKIDSWLDAPEHIETYRDWEIYKLNGYGLYYATSDGQETPTWYDSVNSTRLFIDAEYYPTLVYEVHLDSETWMIYRQGSETIRYWVEYDGTILEYFTTLDDAQEYARLESDALAEELEEEQQDTEDPELDEELEPDAEDNSTIGDILDARKILISGVTAALGLGFLALGSVRRQEQA